MTRLAIAMLAVLTAGPVGAAVPAQPAVGAWATYRWTSTARTEVPVLVKEERGDQVSWSVAREAVPLSIFVTYAIVAADARRLLPGDSVFVPHVDGPLVVSGHGTAVVARA